MPPASAPEDLLTLSSSGSEEERENQSASWEDLISSHASDVRAILHSSPASSCDQRVLVEQVVEPFIVDESLEAEMSSLEQDSLSLVSASEETQSASRVDDSTAKLPASQQDVAVYLVDLGSSEGHEEE